MKRKYLSVCIALATASLLPPAAQAQSEQPLAVDKITVLGNAADQAEILPLEHSASVSKIGAAVAELPYSVAVVDQAFIQDSGAKNIQDALLYSSGIYAGAFGADTRGDWTKVRGVEPINYLDGLRSHYGSYNNVRPNTYALERIEVLKGPASVLYGQGSVGGIINAVSKRPQPVEGGELWAQLGSYERKQIAGDLTGPLDAQGRWLFRLVGLARDSGTQVDHVDDDELLFSPALTWRPDNQTRLILLANYQKREGAVSAQFLPAYGTLLPGAKGPVGPETFVGEPGWDRYDREQSALTLMFDRQLDDTWSFSAIARYVDAETSTREHWPDIGSVPTANGDVTRTLYSVDASTQAFNWDARLKAQFNLGVSEHQLLIGVDSQDAETDRWNYYYGVSQGGTLNLYDPVYGNIPGALPTVDRPSTTLKQLGFYLADQVRIGHSILTAAARYDDTENIQQGSGRSAKADAVTGLLGYMYQFDSGLAPYISYSESFEPNTGDDGLGNLLDPTEGEQVEVGLKYLSPENDLSITLAHFDIEQTNRVATGDVPGGLKQVGAQIDGWELQLQKQWRRLNLLLNLTDLSAEDGSGARLPYVAERQASAWGSYRFGNGWRAGLGARYTGSNVGWGGAPEVPSVTLYDAMVGYETGDWEFTLDVKNLTDKTYISWCRSAGTDCGYGEKLNATLNARYRF